MTSYSLADVNLLYDATDVFLCSHKGNCILQLLRDLDKRVEWVIRLNQGGVDGFVCLCCRHSCELHVTNSRLVFASFFFFIPVHTTQQK